MGFASAASKKGISLEKSSKRGLTLIFLFKKRKEESSFRILMRSPSCTILSTKEVSCYSEKEDWGQA